MTRKKSVLGKGLGALISSTPPEREQRKVSVRPAADTLDDGVATDVLAHIEVDKVESNPYQPRMDFDPEALKELAQSIKENGLVQPVTVRRHKGKFQLISGERRVRACRVAGIPHIPAYIRQVETDEEMLELALIENIQRQTLNPIEIARSYQKLVVDYRHTPEELARKLGKNRSTVVNFIRLLKLPERIRESIQKNEISMGHARALITLPEKSTQIRIWQKAVREGLSVRKVEELVQNLSDGVTRKPPARKTKKATDPHLEELSQKLRPGYGTKVSITANKSGTGHISFEFYSIDDFERLYELLLKG